MKMTRSLTLAAALLASTAFGSAAFAGGDYYEGATKSPVVTIDRTETGKIGGASSREAQRVAAAAVAPGHNTGIASRRHSGRPPTKGSAATPGRGVTRAAVQRGAT